MKFNITSRDIKFFLLGLFASLLLVSIYDWKDFKEGFWDGYNGYEYQGQIEKKN